MKEDLRVIKTKTAIRNSFISLIEEKGFENVKIIDIAQRANVNRNTIYLHYESKEMIIEEFIDEIFTKELVDFNISSYLNLRGNKKQAYVMFKKIFDVIYKNIEIYRIILTDQNLSGYLTLKMKKVKSYLLEPLKPTLKNEVVIEYMISGVFGIFRNWVVYDKGSVDDNAKLIADLVIQNSRHLQR